jgi:hypothetical protein
MFTLRYLNLYLEEILAWATDAAFPFKNPIASNFGLLGASLLQ